jgi:4-amino-4-deoxy-L-arabinose transferase-like glycosyltransferase
MTDKNTATTAVADFSNTSHTAKYLRSILVLAIVMICFTGIFNRDLWTPDEPRVAAISLEMSRSGNLIIPQLAGEPFIEKPPLYFVAAAGLVHSLGPTIGNTGAIRLTSVLFALATLLVAFLLAKRLGDTSFAFLSLIIFGTMFGFIENFHWIRVDTALTFFVIAAVWCFAEVYLAGRARFLLLAGLFAAGAFLSKGPIGPILIAIPWAGLCFIGYRQPTETASKKTFFLPQHLFGLLIFILFSGFWIILLKLTGDQELWHEWFWVHQVGRLTGTAVGTGHLRSGQPFYYLITVILYSLPWLPLVLVWFAGVFKYLKQERTISRENLFLLIWGVGSIVFLSLSVTKRSIYLYPALPAFAMMAGMVLKQSAGRRWFAVYTLAWSILGVTIMALWGIMPLAAPLLQSLVPEQVAAFLNSFRADNLMAMLALAAGLYLIFKRRQIDPIFRFTMVTTLMYIVFLCGPLSAVNQFKSMKPGMQDFAGQFTTEQRVRIAGWNFSETMLANFYYYCNWSVPLIKDEEHLHKILNHEDSQYDSVLINRTRSLETLLKSPYRIKAEGNPRHSHKNKRKVFWVEGLK